MAPPMIWRTGPFGGSMTNVSSAPCLVGFLECPIGRDRIDDQRADARHKIPVVAGVVPRQHFRRHRFLVERGDVLDGFDRLLAVEHDLLAGLVLNGAAEAPQQAAPCRVRVVAVAERNADRMAFGFQLGAADAHVVPGVGLHPDLVPHALAIHGGEVDVEVRECRPGLVFLVVADLTADRADLAVLLLGRLDEVRDVDEEFLVEVRSAGAVPAEQVVARLADASAAARAATLATGMWSTVTWMPFF